MNTSSQTVDVKLKDDLKETLERGGFQFHEEISVPVRGEYVLRIAVHDVQGDRVGAVEIPISSVSGLPPINKE